MKTKLITSVKHDKWYDITLTLGENMVTYPGDPRPIFQQNPFLLEEGKQLSITKMTFLNHLGTHVDYPSHLIVNAPTSSDISLDTLMGKAFVLDVTSEATTISIKLLKKKLRENQLKDSILLLKTGISKHLVRGERMTEYPVLSIEAANFLVEQGLKAIGIDSLSIDPIDSPNLPLHHIFLEAKIPIIEGLYLEKVSEGEYWLICLPLKLEKLDGAPARAVLFELEK